MSIFAGKGRYYSFLHGFHMKQLRFNLAQLNPISADLHLMVDSAQIFNVAIRQPSHQVARPIHPSLVMLRLSFSSSLTAKERIMHEFLRGQLWTIQVATGHTDTTNAQFACYTDRLQ